MWKATVQSQKVPETTTQPHKKFQTQPHPPYNSNNLYLKCNAGMPDDTIIFSPCTRHPTLLNAEEATGHDNEVCTFMMCPML